MEGVRGDLSGRLAALEGRTIDKVTFGGLLAVAVGLIFSIVAFGGDQFGAGREIGLSLASIDKRLDQIEAAQAKPAPSMAAAFASAPGSMANPKPSRASAAAVR